MLNIDSLSNPPTMFDHIHNFHSGVKVFVIMFFFIKYKKKKSNYQIYSVSSLTFFLILSYKIPDKPYEKKRNKIFIHKSQLNKFGLFVRKKIIKYIGKKPSTVDSIIVNNSKNFIY